MLPIIENPSCLQTTLASFELQRLSHTVPQTSLIQISTRPLPWTALPWTALPCKRKSPILHAIILVLYMENIYGTPLVKLISMIIIHTITHNIVRWHHHYECTPHQLHP